MNRPKIKTSEANKIAAHFFGKNIPELLLIGVRGYFLNSIGKKDQNDFNCYDDAMIVLEKDVEVKTFNANTDPTKLRADVAMLKVGIYKFYKGRHKNRIDALRAFPEGVKWDCVRQDKNGKWYEAKCSHINIHDGGLNDTWSAGCQTLPNYAGNRQFTEFRDRVYRLMTKYKLKTISYLLITEEEMSRILNEKAAQKVTKDPIAGNDVPASVSLQSSRIVSGSLQEVENSANSATLKTSENSLKDFADKFVLHAKTDSAKNIALVIVSRIGAGIGGLWTIGITGQIFLILMLLIISGSLIYALYFYHSRIWEWIKTIFNSFNTPDTPK